MRFRWIFIYLPPLYLSPSDLNWGEENSQRRTGRCEEKTSWSFERKPVVLGFAGLHQCSLVRRNQHRASPPWCGLGPHLRLPGLKNLRLALMLLSKTLLELLPRRRQTRCPEGSWRPRSSHQDHHRRRRRFWGGKARSERRLAWRLKKICEIFAFYILKYGLSNCSFMIWWLHFSEKAKPFICNCDIPSNQEMPAHQNSGLP